MDFFYEVSPEFATPAHRVFDASSGYLTSELKIGFKRQFTERLEFVDSARLWVISTPIDLSIEPHYPARRTR